MTVKSHCRGYIFRFHPIVLHYLKETIWKRNETCCRDNPYKIKMSFSYEGEYQPNEQEQMEFIQLLKNTMPDENGALYPYLCKRNFLAEKEKVCVLCNERKGEYTDYDCMNCRADMLMFLEIMHHASNWIPLGWRQSISHRIPPNPSFSGLRYNVSTVYSSPSDVPYNIRTHLALSMSRCSNQNHIPTLKMLCICMICAFMIPPCPDISRLDFISNPKKIPSMSKHFVRIFKNTINVFENSFLNICPSDKHKCSRYHHSGQAYGYSIMFDYD